MKKILIFFGLLLFCHFANAQNITINITGSPDSVVKINYPVDGINYIYWVNQKIYTLNSKQSVKVPNTMETAGYIYIINNGKNKPVFIEPEKSLQIYITDDGKNQTLKAKGDNADGITLYNSFNHPFYFTKANEYLKQDSIIASVRNTIKTNKDKEIHAFDSLLTAKKISAQFHKYATRDIRYYYAAVLSAVIIGDYARTTYPLKHPYYKASMNKDYEDAWPQIYKADPIDDQFTMGAPEFFYYAKDYTTWYKQLYLAKKNGKYNDDPVTPENQFDKFYNGFVMNFTGKTLEYLLARYIFDEAMEKQYQEQLIDLYDSFVISYPKSKFTVFLTPLINEVKDYHKKSTKALSSNQMVLASDSIKSFKKLAWLFKGKTVYIDMWATWCGPCKAEFEYSADLDKFLKEKNVEMLYISMDNDAADKQWLDMIKYYKLSGKHIRVNKSLREDLMKNFWDGKSYTIPRYVIIKGGEVVEREALHPSDKEELYKQISKYL